MSGTTFTDAVATPGQRFGGPSIGAMPSAGAGRLFFSLALDDDSGEPVDADATPVCTATQAGVDMSDRLDTVRRIHAGRYSMIYRLLPADEPGTLVVNCAFAVDGQQRAASWPTLLQNGTDRFVDSDRELLNYVAERSGDIYVTPLQVTVQDSRSLSDALDVFANYSATHVFNAVDATGAPIDLTGKTVDFIVFDRANPQVAIAAIGGTVGGESNSQITIAMNLSTVGHFRWVLVNVTDQVVLGTGSIDVRTIPASSP